MSEAKQNGTYDVKAGLATITDGFTVCGLSVTTHNKDGKATEDINALWEKFFAENIGQRLESRADDTIYAVYSDYQGDHNDPYRLTIGYRIDEDDSAKTETGLETVHVTRGEYAALSAQGQQPQALLQTWEAIWSSDLNRTFKTDFEVYGPRFFEEGVNEVLIYLGVES